MDFLPVDVYRFLGCDIGIRSNSREILTHFRSMYGRFYQAGNSIASNPEKEEASSPSLTVEVIDDLDGSNEFIVNDGYYIYRLSKSGDSFYFIKEDLHTGIQDFSGYCDPLTLLQSGILSTVSLATNDFHLVHAGVVSWENEGIILPANSGMGKTTLVVKLVLQGCKFLSDEVACFHSELDRLELFPRKLNLRQGSQELLGLPLESSAVDYSRGMEEPLWMLDVEDIAPNSLAIPCRPRYLLFLRGFGEKPRLDYVSRSNALFELVRSSISPNGDPAFLLYKFASLMNEVECFSLVMGNPDATAEKVMQLVDT